MPQARYEVRLYSPVTGLLTAIFDTWNVLHYERKLNDLGTYTFSFPLADSRYALFALDAILEVWRTIPGEDPYLDFVGFHRTPEMSIISSKRMFSSTGRSLLDLVARKAILYPSVSAYTLKGGPGETCIKQYVDENAGAGAGAATRVTSGVTPGLTVAVDSALGDTWFGDRPFVRVLDVIKEIALTTRIDFDVFRTGPLTFEFRTFFPQLGTDRRLTVIFAPHLANMNNPVYVLSRTEEATCAIALGQGTGTSRQRVSAVSAAATDSLWNKIEVVQDAGSESTYNGLLSAANKMLEEASAEETFTFDIMTTAAAVYGRDFFLGDIITARFETVERAMKISGLTVDVTAGTEKVAFTFSQIPRVP